MKRKLVSFLGLFICVIAFLFSIYSLATKRYEHAIVKEVPNEEHLGTSDVPGVISGAGEALGVDKIGEISSQGNVGGTEELQVPASDDNEPLTSKENQIEGSTKEERKENGDQSEKSEEGDLISVPLAIDYGNGQVDSFDSEIESGTSVYDYLKSVATVEVSEYSLGVFVESINDIGSDSGAGRYWLYEVNGEKPNVGADQYKLSDGDEVRWIYTEV